MDDKSFARNHIMLVLIYMVLGVLALLGMMGIKQCADKKAANPPQAVVSSAEENEVSASDFTPVYNHYSVVELFDALISDADETKAKHLNEYVEVEGYLGSIDDDGDCVAISAALDDNEHFGLLQMILCYVKSDDQRQTVAKLSRWDKVIVRGKINYIDEVYGFYSLEVDSIEPTH